MTFLFATGQRHEDKCASIASDKRLVYSMLISLIKIN